MCLPLSTLLIGCQLDPGMVILDQSLITAPSSPGTYPYICTTHPSMTGILIVK
jgi:plastocyanin